MIDDIVSFPDLSKHEWLPGEKEAFLWLSKQPKEDGTVSSLREWARRFNLNESTVANWSSRLAHNEPLKSKRGRPNSLDEIAKDDLINAAKRLREEHGCITTANFLPLLNHFVAESAERNGYTFSPVCMRTARRKQQELDLLG